MLFHTLIPIVAAFSSITSAQPTNGKVWGDGHADISDFQNSVPLDNGNGQTLPPPTGSLKYITLGRGTQNYTCKTAGQPPSSIGAVATLYDVSRLLSLPAPYNLQAINNSPRVAINVPTSKVPATVQAKAIGHHYFNAGGQPIFDFGSRLLVGKKLANIPAPANASAGPLNDPPQDLGAVDWLQLGDAGGSKGLSLAYRVECAGGKPPATCASTGFLNQEYSCLYWFYG